MHRPTLIVVGLLLAAAPALAQKPEEVEDKILEQVNAYRAKKDAPKLLPDEKLTAIAQEHARGMAKADKFGDDDKDGHVWMGKDMVDRLVAAKYNYSEATENVSLVGKGSRSPADDAMRTWIASKGHEENLRSKEVTVTGIGAAKSAKGRWYFVQIFANTAVAKPTFVVTLENKTKRTITFRIGRNKQELKAGEAGELSFSTKASKTQLGVTWPGGKKEETFDLADKGSYAFTEKEEGKFAFEKVESK